MKIYTRGGDQGETSLFGGRRVAKDHVRIESYGQVDELNALLGVALLHVDHPQLQERLRRIQSELFTLGADLATPLDVASDYVVRMDQAPVARLEQEIDQAEAELPPLRHFILPGGGAGAAHLHLARTVCRRAERATARLAGQEPVNPAALVYLNRLSDWLFVMARLVNHREGQAETPWISPRLAQDAPDRASEESSDTP